MSNELKEAAQQAVDAFDVFSDADDFVSLFALTQKMRALRTAIQQAETQQPATGEPVDHVGDRADMMASKPAEPVGVNQLRKELSDANDFIQSLADLCVKYETLLGYRKTKAPEGASELAEARGESNVNIELDLAMPDSICDHVFVLDPKSSIRICNKCGTVECKKHTHPAPSVPDDSKRLDYLQDRGATIDLIAGVADFYPMQFRVGGLHSSANIDVRAAIDAAMLAAKDTK